jgi:cellulose biosynthesis protein BcsQ
MKTIYILVSAKGGVGKSVAARAMVQYFRETKKIETAAIDIDVDKWGLSKFYDNENMFEGCDILHPNNKDEVVTKMEEFFDGSGDDSVLVLDTPGDLNSDLWNKVAMSDVVDSFVDDGAKVVIINIVGEAYECRQSINQFPSIFGKNTEYVLAYSANLQGKIIDDVELFKG